MKRPHEQPLTLAIIRAWVGAQIHVERNPAGHGEWVIHGVACWTVGGLLRLLDEEA